MWSSRSWWEEPGWERRVHVELAEIMDELEPGWAAWAPVEAG
ncbi:MAG TPA: hypothetical protein VHI71_11615 [Actinomycetota bacterium]|nr:hypothetical protein [Actinomycetota bacterium]